MIRFFLLFFFFAGSALLSFFTGSGEIHRWRSEGAPPFSLILEGISPQKECPLVEPKAFAVVLVAHNAAPWCERALRSVFEQDYDYFRVLFVDDASSDGTFEKAQQFLVDNGLEERMVAVRNERQEGFTASLFRAAQICLDKEIILPLDACNWLAVEGELSQLNRVFQNPDVWVAWGASVDYPHYQLREAVQFDPKEVRRKGYRLSKPIELLAFYAGLVKSIRLPDLFAENDFAWQIPLLEMAGGRTRVLAEPLIFVNRAASKRSGEKKVPFFAESFREPLAEFPAPVEKKIISAGVSR